MNKVFFDELGLGKPDIYLNAQGNSQIEMMADIMIKFEGISLTFLILFLFQVMLTHL